MSKAREADNDISAGERLASQAQMRYIGKIEELLGISFSGTSFDDASNFIDTYKDRYQAKLHTPYKYR